METATSSAVSTARTSGLTTMRAKRTFCRASAPPMSSACLRPSRDSGRSSSRMPSPSTAWAWRMRKRSTSAPARRTELHQRGAPAALPFVGEAEGDHQLVALEDSVHQPLQRARALAVHDAQLEHSALGRLVDVRGDELLHLVRRERMQIQLAIDRKLDRFVNHDPIVAFTKPPRDIAAPDSASPSAPTG